MIVNSKYNIGDIVKIRDWEELKNEYRIGEVMGTRFIVLSDTIFLETEKQYCGQEFTIADIVSIQSIRPNRKVDILCPKESFSWGLTITDEMVDLVPSICFQYSELDEILQI